MRVGGKIPPLSPFLPSFFRRRNESWRLNENEGGRGAEKLKRGDEHAEFVRKEEKKKKPKTAAAASQMSHSKKEGRQDGRGRGRRRQQK